MANTTNLDLVKPLGTDHALISVINSNMDKIDVESGKVRGNFASDYDSTASYAVGAFCLYNGVLYRCNTAISGGEAWNASHWDEASVGAEVRELNSKTAIKDLGSFATQSAMEAAFSSELANLESGQQKQILVANSAAFGPLVWTTTWCGLIQKVGGGTGRGIVQLRTFSALPGHDIVCQVKDGSYYWDEYALNSKTFAQIYNDEITAGTSKTYTLTAPTQVAMVFINNGNGSVAVWAISFRTASEIGKERLSTSEAYTTITTSGMTFTVACTYTAKVKVVVF